MRQLKTQNYLKQQTRGNLAKAALCILLFFVIIFLASVHVLFSLRLEVLDEAAFLLSLVPLALFYFYLRKYHIYNSGYQGEKNVTNLLRKNLDDNYYLINGLYLRGGGGDIDHILLGPMGILVLETKNWSGKIFCNGDDWKRPGKSTVESPSRQVKRNAATLRHIIDDFCGLQPAIKIESAVLIANNHAKLQISNPTVPILELHQLLNFIAAQPINHAFTSRQIEQLSECILKQAKQR
jgi:hypothetical protein